MTVTAGSTHAACSRRRRRRGQADPAIAPPASAAPPRPVGHPEQQHAVRNQRREVRGHGREAAPGGDEVQLGEPVTGAVLDAWPPGETRPDPKEWIGSRRRAGNPALLGQLVHPDRLAAGEAARRGCGDEQGAFLEHRFGDRVRTVVLTGDEDADRQAMQDAADGPIDVVLDLVPPAAGTTPVRAAAMTVREYGRVILTGRVGMLVGDDLALPYAWLMRNSVTVRGASGCTCAPRWRS